MRSLCVARCVAFAGLLASVAAVQYPLVYPLQDSITPIPWTINRVFSFATLINKVRQSNPNMNLSSSLLDLLRSDDMSALPVTIVTAMDKNVWMFLGVARLLSLGQANVMTLLSQKTLAPQSLSDTATAYVSANVSTPNAIAGVSQVWTDPVMFRVLLTRLGDPSTWSGANITAFKDVLFYFPIETLFNIRGNDSISQLTHQAQLCVKGGSEPKSASCPSPTEAMGQTDTSRSHYFIGLLTWLNTNQYGPAYNWNNATFSLMDVTTLPMNQLAQVQPSVLVSKTSQIIQMLQTDSRKRAFVGRTLIENLLTGMKVASMTTDTAVLAVLNTLGTVLTDYVRETDLPDVALNNTQVAAMMKTAELKAVVNGNLEALTTAWYTQILTVNKSLQPADARNIGLPLLSLASPSALVSIVNNLNPTKDDMKQIISGIVGNGVVMSSFVGSSGVSARAKLMLLRDKIISLAGGSGSLDITVIPPIMYDMLSQLTFQNLPSSSIATMLASMDSMSDQQIGICLSKLVVSDVNALPPNPRAGLSLRQIQAAAPQMATLQTMAKDMPATSTLALQAAVQTWWTSTNPVDMTTLDPSSPMFQVLGASEARRILNTTLWANLDSMRDTIPTRGACLVLKRMLVNLTHDTLGTSSEAEAFSLLNLGDMRRLPVGVVAAFSPDLIKGLDNRFLAVLLEHLIMMGDMVYRSTGITPSSAKLIYEQGFRALNKPLVLTSADVEKLQTQLPLAPAAYLMALQSDAAPDALRILNLLAMTPLMPCLDSGRRDAIANMITNYMGNDPSQWEDLSAVCCLLYVLPTGTLQRVPMPTLASCRCVSSNLTLLRSMEYTKEMTCRTDLGADYDNELTAQDLVAELQGAAYLQIADPRTYGISNALMSDLPFCAEAVIFGADSISSPDMANITNVGGFPCLAALGSLPMQQQTASVLAAGLKKTLSQPSFIALTTKNMTDMGFIYRGVNLSDIGSVPKLSYPDLNDAVMSLGDPEMGFTSDQLYVWATKVLSDWKSPVSTWTTADMLIFNYLFCGVNTSIIDQLDSNYFKDAVPSLTITLGSCNTTNITIFLAPFANKAVAAYGPISAWTKAMVNELDVIVAGLTSDNLKAIPPQAMAGLTPAAVMAFPNSDMAVLSPSQILNLDIMTALAVSTDQKTVFTPGMTAALMEAQGSSGAMWIAPSASTTLLLLLGSTLTLIV